MEGMTMDYPYTVNDIITNFHISKTTFYAQVKKNTDFFTANSTKIRTAGEKNKPFTRYNQAVFDFFASQYGIEEAVSAVPDAVLKKILLEGGGGTPTEAPETPPESIFSPADDVKPTQEDKNALQAKIEALEAKLAEAEAERKELISQNSHLLLLLSQEKQEKQLLLPQPKKSLSTRLKSLFHKKEE